MNIIEVDKLTHRVVAVGGITLQKDELVTIMPTEDYHRYLRLTRSENYFYWRGLLTGLAIAFVASGVLAGLWAVAK
jgi:hypothetical protein